MESLIQICYFYDIRLFNEENGIMTLNQLRYFCTASRCHSITRGC